MKRVFVVVDMQNDFIDGSLGTKEAVLILPKVRERLRKALADENTQVCFTLDTHQKNYLETQEGSNLPVVHCVEGTHGWYLSPELEQELIHAKEPIQKEKFYQAGEVDSKVTVFKKEVFGSVALAEYVKKLYEKEPDMVVELVGLCTDICVVSNAILLKSFLPELRITVDAACCAGVTVESHNKALATMKMCQIAVENEV